MQSQTNTLACCCAEIKPPSHLVGDESYIGDKCGSGGACRWRGECADGTQLDGECPGSSEVKCCVPDVSDSDSGDGSDDGSGGVSVHSLVARGCVHVVLCIRKCILNGHVHHATAARPRG